MLLASSGSTTKSVLILNSTRALPGRVGNTACI